MATYSTVQLAKHLGVARDTIYRWMRARKIKAGRVIQVGGDTTFQVRQWTEKDVTDIRNFMKENYRKGRGRKKH